MRIERTYDMGLIRGVFTHHDIYDHITDDGALDVTDYEPLDNPALYYLAALEDVFTVAGVFLCVPVNCICYEGHAAILPEYRKNTEDIYRAAFAWMFENTPCQKIVGYTPAYNTAARLVSRRAGMVTEGRSAKSFLKRGVLHDRIIFGIEKEKLCPPQ